MKRRRAIAWGAFAVILLSGIGVVAAARRSRITAPEDEIPVSQVKRGDLDLKVVATGELRATHTVTLTAPPVGGGALQITRLSHTGVAVKKGDVVVEFDPSEQRYKLDQNRSELLQAEQEITKAKADAAVLAAQDKVALLKDRFDVRRAELDVQKNELVSAIDGKKNQLALEQAQRVLAELEQDIQSHTASGQATIYLAQEKRNKANLAMAQAQENIDKMQVPPPWMGWFPSKRTEARTSSFFRGCLCPTTAKGIRSNPAVALRRSSTPERWKSTARSTNATATISRPANWQRSSSMRSLAAFFTAPSITWAGCRGVRSGTRIWVANSMSRSNFRIPTPGCVLASQRKSWC